MNLMEEIQENSGIQLDEANGPQNMSYLTSLLQKAVTGLEKKIDKLEDKADKIANSKKVNPKKTEKITSALADAGKLLDQAEDVRDSAMKLDKVNKKLRATAKTDPHFAANRKIIGKEYKKLFNSSKEIKKLINKASNRSVWRMLGLTFFIGILLGAIVNIVIEFRIIAKEEDYLAPYYDAIDVKKVEKEFKLLKENYEENGEIL